MRPALRLLLAAITTAFLVVVSAIPTWAMTLTFVRHAESQANAAGIIDTSVPGPGLSPLGQQQAQDIAAVLAGNGYDGIYVSSMLRTQQTAQPLLDLLGTSATVLPGLREISAGIFEGASEDEGLGRLGYALAPVAWTLGARFVPVLGGEDGNGFDARVDDAVRQIYDSGDQNALAFSHGATIMFWVMMNVDNPDLGLLLSHQLDNVEAVVIEGSPEEGWTLVSWAGIPVAAEPSLPIKLFVNVRDLVVAPQTALYEVGRAFATGDIAALANAVRDGIVNVARTVVEFVPDMVKDIVDSVGDLASPTSEQDAPVATLAADHTAEVADPEPSTTEVGAAAAASEDDAKSDVRATTSETETSSGATDLTDGNKVEPGEPVARTEDQSDDDVVDDAVEDVTEDVTDEVTAPTDATDAVDNEDTDNEDAADDSGAESDSATSQQNAA
jgi:broad specificity phosphatase PhoE